MTRDTRDTCRSVNPCEGGKWGYKMHLIVKHFCLYIAAHSNKMTPYVKNHFYLCLTVLQLYFYLGNKEAI